jgi:integration host factor subunit beta
MTRKDIIRKVVNLGLTHGKAKTSVEAVLQAINEGLTKEEKVKIAGFGTFYVKNKRARPGMNPKTGEKIQIVAKKYPVFKASPELRNKINKT